MIHMNSTRIVSLLLLFIALFLYNVHATDDTNQKNFSEKHKQYIPEEALKEIVAKADNFYKTEGGIRPLKDVRSEMVERILLNTAFRLSITLIEKGDVHGAWAVMNGIISGIHKQDDVIPVAELAYAYKFLADIEIALKKNKESKKHYQKGVETAKNGITYYSRLSKVRNVPLAHYNLGFLFIFLGEEKTGQAHLVRALEQSPELIKDAEGWLQMVKRLNKLYD